VCRVPGPVERVGLEASVTVELLLPAATAEVHRFPGQPRQVEGVHHGDGVRDFVGGGGL
jgi:hypothetical protein